MQDLKTALLLIIDKINGQTFRKTIRSTFFSTKRELACSKSLIIMSLGTILNKFDLQFSFLTHTQKLSAAVDDEPKSSTWCATLCKHFYAFVVSYFNAVYFERLLLNHGSAIDSHGILLTVHMHTALVMTSNTARKTRARSSKKFTEMNIRKKSRQNDQDDY